MEILCDSRHLLNFFRVNSPIQTNKNIHYLGYERNTKWMGVCVLYIRSSTLCYDNFGKYKHISWILNKQPRVSISIYEKQNRNENKLLYNSMA